MKKHKLAIIVLLSSMLCACDPPEIKEAKKEVSEAMRDPGSAEFRNTRSFKVDNYFMVCGEVNGKNAFGALAGHQYFLYYDPLMRISTNSEESLAIYKCCSSLESSGTKGDAKSTLEVEACTNMKPPMPLL